MQHDEQRGRSKRAAERRAARHGAAEVGPDDDRQNDVERRPFSEDAAAGDTHYFVYKEDRADRTVSRIRQLSADERIKEIAHMIAGAKPSENAFQSARELLALRGEELVG